MRRLLIILLVMIAALPSLVALELPAAPDGFAWHEAPEIKGAFLVPAGWHVFTEQAKGTLAYFVTEESFAPPDYFKTGVTINVFLGNKSAPANVQAMIAAEAKKYAVPVEAGQFGPFK